MCEGEEESPCPICPGAGGEGLTQRQNTDHSKAGADGGVQGPGGPDPSLF